MEKLAVLFLVMVLSSCFSAGNHDVLSFRNTFVERFNTYSISLYDDEDDKLVKTEYVVEDNFKNNIILTAFTGYTVVDTKTYRKDFYRTETLTVDRDGVLNCGSSPVVYKKGERVKAVGEVAIDGVDYVMASTKLKGFVALVKQDGSFYKHIGQIRHGRLAILDTNFVPFPADLKMMQISTSKTVQTEPVKGFDVKYEGVKLGQMRFTVLDYSAAQGDNGQFENISFPNQPGIISFNGVGIKVLQANKERIDYIILK